MHKSVRGAACAVLFGLSLTAAAAADTVGIGADGALPGSLFSGDSKGLNLTCNWREANGTPTAAGQTGIRYGYIELAAGYWQFFLSPYFPKGTQFVIHGQYPASRNFSYQLYNGANLGLGYLDDYVIQPDPGSQSPFNGINTLDTAIAPGGNYTLHILYGAAPATPAPNTLYVDSSNFSLGSVAVFIYRIYNNLNNLPVYEHGGVPMPAIYEVTAQGDVPLSSLDQTAVCDVGIGQRNARRVVRAKVSDTIYAKPERPNPIPAQPVPAPPVFQLRDDPSDVLVNVDNRYIYTILSQKSGDLVLVRAKAPTYATGPGAGSDPQLRHWSVCENAYVTVETYQCIEDSDAVIDGDGFFNIVISVPAKMPANANHAHGFDWLTYGTDDEGAPILRHMLASPDFTQSAFQVPAGDAAQAPQIMGDYFPVATYCAGSVFDAHTSAGETPAQVFAGCAAGK
jgi:hypothetical protein